MSAGAGLVTAKFVRAIDLKDGAIFQPNSRQLPAPYASAIDGKQMGFQVQPECRPMACDDCRAGIAPIGNAKPGSETDGSFVWRA